MIYFYWKVGLHRGETDKSSVCWLFSQVTTMAQAEQSQANLKPGAKIIFWVSRMGAGSQSFLFFFFFKFSVHIFEHFHGMSNDGYSVNIDAVIARRSVRASVCFRQDNYRFREKRKRFLNRWRHEGVVHWTLTFLYSATELEIAKVAGSIWRNMEKEGLPEELMQAVFGKRQNGLEVSCYVTDPVIWRVTWLESRLRLDWKKPFCPRIWSNKKKKSLSHDNPLCGGKGVTWSELCFEKLM